MKILNKKIQSFIYFMIFAVCMIMIKCQANMMNSSIYLQMINQLQFTPGEHVTYKVNGYQINNPEVYAKFHNDLFYGLGSPSEVYFNHHNDKPYLYVIVDTGLPSYGKVQCVINLLGQHMAVLDKNLSTNQCFLNKIHHLYQLYLSGKIDN